MGKIYIERVQEPKQQIGCGFHSITRNVASKKNHSLKNDKLASMTMMQNTLIQMKESIKQANTVICDMDDTLVYTSYANFRAYQIAIYEVFGVTLSYTALKRFTKESLLEYFPLLERHCFDQIVEIKNELFADYIQETSLNYILTHLIKNISQDKKLILSTNATKSRAVLLLKHHNLYHYFDDLFYKENHKENKFETIVNTLGTDRQKVVVFENETTQIALAEKVGIPAQNIFKI